LFRPLIFVSLDWFGLGREPITPIRPGSPSR
jgi:hypothetical protein